MEWIFRTECAPLWAYFLAVVLCTTYGAIMNSFIIPAIVKILDDTKSGE